MRLRKMEKRIVAAILTAALIVPAGIYSRNVKAVDAGAADAGAADAESTKLKEKKISFAEGHESSFELARTAVKNADNKELSGYEVDSGKHWVKLFSKFDGIKNIFDHEELPDGTVKLKVEFEISDYDLDQEYPLTWATGIGGWASGKPTGVTINGNGDYEAVLDIKSETDGLGRAIGSGDINSASLQLVFQLAEPNAENIADVKKTKVTFKSCYAYTEPVVATPSPTPTATPTSTPTATPDPTGSSGNSGNTGNTGNTGTVTPTATPPAGQQNSGAAKENTVTKLKAAKKTVTIKKGKSKAVKFNITAADKTKKTTDKITKVQLSNKKIAKVGKKSIDKKNCTIKLKGLKKGKTTLTVQIGKKKAKVKIKVV